MHRFIFLIIPLIFTIELFDGTEMPSLGFGTAGIDVEIVGDVVEEAIDAGYRHLDCASFYKNEHEIGKRLQTIFETGKVSRSELWITSKLWCDVESGDGVLPALRQTLEDLRLDYLDLYLIHWPLVLVDGKPKRYDHLRTISIWKELESAVHMGLVKYIGVSNFSPKKIEDFKHTVNVPVAVNQVELHPYLTQKKLRKYCDENQIVVTAYSPLGRPGLVDNTPQLLQDSTVLEVSKQSACTPAQVLLAWSISQNLNPIPKSQTPSRIRSNFEALDCKLTSYHIDALNQLNQDLRYVRAEVFLISGEEYSTYLWDEDAISPLGKVEL